MAPRTWFAYRKNRLEGNQLRGARRRLASHEPARAGLRIERLEDRLALSGFGPGDGAYIVEARTSGIYNAVAIQPQIQPTDPKDRIVAAGSWSSVFGVERYDSLGNADTTYGNGGLATPVLGEPADRGSGRLAIQADGKVVMSGTVLLGSPGEGAVGISRLNLDGSPDTSFGSGGGTAVDVQQGPANSYGVALQSSGKVVVSGASSSTNDGTATTSALVARFTTSGALDSGKGGFGQTVHGNPQGYALTTYGQQYQRDYGIAVQSNDKLVTVGYETMPDSTARTVVTRYTAGGVLDITFNKHGYAVLSNSQLSSSLGFGVAIQSDGKIVAVGATVGSGGEMFAARFNVGGTLDTTFGGGNGYVLVGMAGTTSVAAGVAVQPDGKIVLSGNERSTVAGSPGTVMVARLNPDGSLDSGFGSGGIKLGSALAGAGYNDVRGGVVALQSDGSMIVAGGDSLGTTFDTSHPFLMWFSGASGAAELAAGGASPVTTATPPLTPAQLKPIVDQAIARWDESGLTAKQDQTLHSAKFSIARLSGGEVGETVGNQVTIDPTAAGYGWFVDPTPADDNEFPASVSGGGLRATGSPAYGGMDLLTVVEHELGHVLGLQHSPIPGDVMDESLPTGVRRQPHAFEAAATPWEFAPTSTVSAHAPAMAPLIASLPTTHDMPSVRDQVLAAWDELIGGKLLH